MIKFWFSYDKGKPNNGAEDYFAYQNGLEIWQNGLNDYQKTGTSGYICEKNM